MMRLAIAVHSSGLTSSKSKFNVSGTALGLGVKDREIPWFALHIILGKVKALMNICRLPCKSCTMGSLCLYLCNPHRMKCLRMCGMPVESEQGVWKIMPKHLLSLFNTERCSASLCLWQ